MAEQILVNFGLLVGLVFVLWLTVRTYHHGELVEADNDALRVEVETLRERSELLETLLEKLDVKLPKKKIHKRKKVAPVVQPKPAN